jgi:hypothetical protein
MIDARSLPDHPADGYGALREHAVRLAGVPGDIARRVVAHHRIYRDSNGNHAFPLVALHGALWAAGFFETTGRLGDALRARYFYNARERAIRMAMLGGFAEGFKSVNRQVFIDTFTNFYFTKFYGGRPGAAGILHPQLFAALNAVHDAARAGTTLPDDQKREVFSLALQFEQEVTVAPGISSEIEKFDCPILTFLCLRPLVRFAYFPRHTWFWFRNFSDKSERIAKAMRSYDLAAQTGWPAVEEAMKQSPVLPAAYWSDPAGYVRQLAA